MKEIVKNVKEASTEDLKKAWDEWDGCRISMGFDCNEVYLELNLRGEGIYCFR